MATTMRTAPFGRFCGEMNRTLSCRAVSLSPFFAASLFGPILSRIPEYRYKCTLDNVIGVYGASTEYVVLQTLPWCALLP